jgi:hypothetical protein
MTVIDSEHEDDYRYVAFDPRSDYVGFVVDKVYLEYGYR